MPRKPRNDEPRIGHNSGSMTEDRRKQLQGYITEIERVDAEMEELKLERGTFYKSADDAGFDTKAMRAVVKMRKIDRDKREAFEAVVEVYKNALGMIADLPLGKAAIERATSGLPIPPPF